ncbi:hypothetical protein KY284_013577 [Solanum tuberosum]|nr:hypothetical protein KY284_013577 [Solanum tuberosum]
MGVSGNHVHSHHHHGSLSTKDGVDGKKLLRYRVIAMASSYSVHRSAGLLIYMALVDLLAVDFMGDKLITRQCQATN